MTTTTTSADATTHPGPGELLVERCLPRYDVGLVEHRLAAADRARCWTALSELDLVRVHTPLMDAAMRVRDLPARFAAVTGREGRPEPPAQLPRGGDGPSLPGWMSLGETEGREIALGAIGRFWQPDIQWYDVSDMSAEDFTAFAEPGWGRIAADLTVVPYSPGRTLLTYEVRTATTDPDSARRFARYWRFVRPFVGHIMRATLATVRADAEAGPMPR